MRRSRRQALPRNPDLLRYIGAVAVSNLGSQSSGLAFPLLALALGATAIVAAPVLWLLPMWLGARRYSHAP